MQHLIYGGEISLDFNEAKHLYTVGGKKVDGVTSILGVISKPALVNWSARMTAEYVMENFEEKMSRTRMEALCEKAKGAHRIKKESAGDIGHLVHSWVENWIKGSKEEPLPENASAKNGCEAFMKWVRENRVEFINSEKVCYSKKHNYAGTYDFTAIVNGNKVLGDIKTSSGIYDEYFFQTAAYQKAVQEETGEEFESHLIVNCKKEPDKDGKILELKYSRDYEKNVEAFLAALTLHRRINELKDEKYA
jgi:Tfp pilus assembly protein FimT